VPEAPALERLLRRDRAVTLAALVALCALAWISILTSAEAGMDGWRMTTFALFPHREAADAMRAMPGMGAMPPPEWTGWDPAAWALSVAMWWVMMIAMMAPSAAPAILLYAHVHRRVRGQGRVQDGLAPTGAFAAGYALIWLAFSVAAAALYWLLERGGIVSAATMGSRSPWLSGGILIGAGLYQLSPLKNVCLSHCRAPASFLARHWRPGASGALRLGAMHGAYCVGCCWMLMALLFVGGVMNLAWIALLTLLVLIEKLLPGGRWAGRGAGVALIVWGLVTLLV
jgi:predicted metal-binding membrane protein